MPPSIRPSAYSIVVRVRQQTTMASLSLPPPRKAPLQPSKLAVVKESASRSSPSDTNEKQKQQGTQMTPTSTTSSAQAPLSYEERCHAAARASKMTPEERRRTGTKLFVPRSLQDFGDGGAFPEIHVAQYPRRMGNPHMQKVRSATTTTTSTSSSKNNSQPAVTASRAITTVKAVQVDKDGEISYDSIVKGSDPSKLVYSRHEHLRDGPATDVSLPTPEQEQAETAKTAAALQAILQSKTALDKPSGSAIVQADTSKNIVENTQYIKYTPNPDAPGYNPAAKQRVIQMVPAQLDPMMPPKHQHLKAPRGPAEDPVPILHAPPSNNNSKLTKAEREAWNIPASISNWKNMRGYTIPLDKRLAADGRHARDSTTTTSTINPHFATLSESLYVAERQARQEVRLRATVHQKLALASQNQRQDELRQLAQQARRERGGGGNYDEHDDEHDDHDQKDESSVQESITRVPDDNDDHDHDDSAKEETEDQVAARQREQMRRERKRERERELRLEQNSSSSHHGAAASPKKKKQRVIDEQDRDVSEKIALGVHTGAGSSSGAGDVDSRLYSQSSGMDSGFGADDEYNAYSKPLFAAGASSASIYRPTRGETAYNADEQYDKLKQGGTSKFQPDKGFAGAEGGMSAQAGARTAPVQFEKEKRK